MVAEGRVSSFTQQQAAQRNSILDVVRDYHDAPRMWDRTITSCSEGCLACLVESTIWQAEFVTAPARVASRASPLTAQERAE